MLTSDDLAGLNFHDLCSAVRAGRVEPAVVVEEVMYRPILVQAAIEARILKPLMGSVLKYEALTLAFNQMAPKG